MEEKERAARVEPGGGTPPRKSKTTSRQKCNEMRELAKNRPILRRKNRGGAPKSNRNALKTGRHVAQLRALRAKAHLIELHARKAIALALGGIVSREI